MHIRRRTLDLLLDHQSRQSKQMQVKAREECACLGATGLEVCIVLHRQAGNLGIPSFSSNHERSHALQVKASMSLPH